MSLLKTEYLSGWCICLTQQGIAYELSQVFQLSYLVHVYVITYAKNKFIRIYFSQSPYFSVGCHFISCLSNKLQNARLTNNSQKSFVQFWYLFTWFAFITQITQCPFLWWNLPTQTTGQTSKLIPSLSSDLKNEVGLLVEIQQAIFCFLIVFLVNRARVTLKQQNNSPHPHDISSLANLSHCGYSGPLSFQGQRQGLLGRSPLSLESLRAVLCGCVLLCAVRLCSSHKPRYLKRVLWLLIRFCKCVLIPPLQCQINVCKMQAFKVLFHQFHTGFFEIKLKCEHFS